MRDYKESRKLRNNDTLTRTAEKEQSRAVVNALRHKKIAHTLDSVIEQEKEYSCHTK